MTIQRTVDINLTTDEFVSELRELPLFALLRVVFIDLVPDRVPAGLTRWAIAYPDQFADVVNRIERTAVELRVVYRNALAELEPSRRCQVCGGDNVASLWPFCSNECFTVWAKPGAPCGE
jgi:hypothetical protein